jgi:hypothetical protein
VTVCEKQRQERFAIIIHGINQFRAIVHEWRRPDFFANRGSPASARRVCEEPPNPVVCQCHGINELEEAISQTVKSGQGR